MPVFDDLRMLHGEFHSRVKRLHCLVCQRQVCSHYRVQAYLWFHFDFPYFPGVSVILLIMPVREVRGSPDLLTAKLFFVSDGVSVLLADDKIPDLHAVDVTENTYVICVVMTPSALHHIPRCVKVTW
jgi:hypothetical protein